MQRIAILGDSDSIKAFSALGFDVYEIIDYEQSAKVLKKIINQKYAIIYITEHLVQYCLLEIKKYVDKPTPAIIPIPGTFGNTGIGMFNVKQSVKRAVGSDILD